MSSEIPELGELVVVKVNKVLDYGVFVDLLEYEGVTGFVHISQVASSWIKNIRNFVKENQIRAAQVTKIDSQKNQIDLSLNKVSSGQQRIKIESFKQMKRVQKLLEVMAKEHKLSVDDLWNEVAEPLLEHYDSLYQAFEAIAIDPKVAELVGKKWEKPVLSLVDKNIEIPVKQVKGSISVSSLEPEGVNTIKKAFQEGKKKNPSIAVLYKGANVFTVTASANDYKSAEKQLIHYCETVTESVKKNKGTAAFEIFTKKGKAES